MNRVDNFMFVSNDDVLVTCNMCEWVGKETELIFLKDEDETYTGCPNCRTDEYMTDLMSV